MTREDLELMSIACKYCIRLKDPEYKNSEDACCFRYSSLTNPNDRCSRFFLHFEDWGLILNTQFEEASLSQTFIDKGYKKVNGDVFRPDGTLVIELSDVPHIKNKLEKEEKEEQYSSARVLALMGFVFFLICRIFHIEDPGLDFLRILEELSMINCVFIYFYYKFLV